MFDIIAETVSKIEQTKRIISEGVSYINNALRLSEKEQTAFLKEQYNERLKLAKEYMQMEVNAYQYRIDEINAQLKALDRQEKDEDYNDKIKRLKEQLKYENDSFNKYGLQKEIAQLTAENEKRLQRESLLDEKGSLQTMIQWTKELYELQEDLYKKALDEQLSELTRQLSSAYGSVANYQGGNAAAAYLNSGEYEKIMQTVQSLVSYYTSSQPVNVYQSISSPVSSPSQLAKEMALALESALKYGY